ncbi:MAG: DUF1329 domain-containing protein [Gammaproteobacteria bacterium]
MVFNLLVVVIFLFILISAALAADDLPSEKIINSENISEYENYLDETLIDLIKKNYFTLEIIPTESFPVHPEYAAATEKNRGKTKLGTLPGEINGYIAGRPFPETPSTDDQLAGDKIAWNMRYAFVGDGGRIAPFYWQYRNMRTDKIERELSFEANSLRFKHRTVTSPIPDLPNNPSAIFNALYLRALAPPDIRNTQLLIHRLEDDTSSERGWMYIGTQRRVRRIPTGQNTDSFLGSDIMIEDFMGYNGRIMDMQWTYLGTKKVLMPFYRHNELEFEKQESDGFNFIEYEGKGGCFPRVKWQFRTAYVLEVSPRWSQHPLSKRVYYVDAETFMPAYGRLYDRSKKLWKLAIVSYSHPDHHLPINKDSYVPIFDGVTMIDLQANHCTTLQARSEASSKKLTGLDFSVQTLRRKGR